MKRASRPVAEQVNQLLRQRIRARHYTPGQRLPAEGALARELGVSRATLRTALAKLAAEGLIIRRQGDGTFVNARLAEVNANLGGILDFTRLIAASGHQPAIQTLSVGPRPPTENEAGALNLASGESVVGLVRLFLADERPLVLATNAIPRHLFPVDLAWLDGRLPIQLFLKRFCGQEIEQARFDIESTLADAAIAELLACPVGVPLLQLHTTFYNSGHQPVATGVSYYDDRTIALRFVQSWQ